MTRYIICAGSITAALFSSSTLAAQGHFSLSSGLDFSTGKYGGTTATDVTYIPIIGKYESDRWLHKLTIPYISITGPGNVTPNIGLATYPTTAVRTDAGLGDVVATSTYSLINSAHSGTVIDVTGKVKLGTADKYKGLGSGVNDYAAEGSAYKMAGQISVFATVGYKLFGQSTGYLANNVFYGSLGASNKFNDRTSAGLIIDYRQPTSALNDPQKIATLFFNYKFTPRWKTQTYFFVGQGNASPDSGGGLMFTEAF